MDPPRGGPRGAVRKDRHGEPRINCRGWCRALELTPIRHEGERQMQSVESATLAKPAASEGFWPKGWWSIVDFKIGIIPLPVFVVLIAVIAGFAATGTVPSDILMAIVLLSMGGLHLRRTGQAHSDHPQHWRGGDFRHLHSFVPCLPSSAAGLDPELGDAIHQGLQLSVSVHCLHHRRQHSGDGPGRSRSRASSKYSFR